jgi:arsenate reductase
MNGDSKISVLFVCVHNSARSQLAEEYLREIVGSAIDVTSAGLEPGGLNPFVVRVLKEDGIDILGKETRDVFELFKSGATFTYVITVCSREAEERCPIFPGRTVRYHWPFEDPSAFTGGEQEILRRTRELAREIKARVATFAERVRERHSHGSGWSGVYRRC